MLLLYGRLVELYNIMMKGMVTMKSTDNREVILNAAQTQFSLQGYHNTSMDAIATAANLSKGGVYHFYKSKTELFIAVIKSGIDMMNGDLDQIIQDDSLKNNELIYRVVKVWIDICLDYPQLATVILNQNVNNLELQLSNEIRTLIETVVDKFCAILNIGIEYKVLKPLDVELTAVMFLGMLSGLCSRCLYFDEVPKREKIIETAYLFVSEGIALK